MINSYSEGSTLGRRLRQLGLVALLMGGPTLAAQAQTLNYPVAEAASVAGTYTDLGTTGTAIATTSTDDANSAAQNIGFTFSYNGTSFTQFVLNTNGAIRLGSAAPSTAALYYDNNTAGTSTDPLSSTDAANTNLLLPFNIDLVQGSGAGGASYQVLTSGTAPNRVCTIQWRNVADKAGAGSDVGNVTQFANFSFQVKLYETTNNIDFVYDQAVPGGGADGLRIPQVGLKGSGLGTGQVLLGVKEALNLWSSTVFQNTNYTDTGHNITKSATPDAGRTYHFNTPVANDVTIQAVYTLGKIAAPGSLPQAVRAYIANVGTAAQTNVRITLSITGANTYSVTGTLASLAAGAGGYLSLGNLPTPLNAGTNVITVSVPSDDNSANNAASATQLVTSSRLSHIDPAKPLDGGGLSGDNTAAGSVLSAKYTLPNSMVLSDALLSFANTGATTSFQVVVYDATGTNGAPGKLLYTSPAQNRPATGGNVTVTFPAIAALQLTGAFHVGIKEAGTGGADIATQTEVPLRSGTFYYSADGATSWLDIAATNLPLRLGIEIGLAAAPVCNAPTALAVTSTTATTAVVTFTDASNTGSYQLIYGPVGFAPATAGTTVAVTASPATLTGLVAGTTYQLYARTSCAGGGTSLLTGPITFTTGCAAVTAITAFPYAESFDVIPAGSALPCGITVLDANADGATWAITKTTPNSAPNAMRYTSAITNSVAANDWFFTPALVLVAGTRYQVAFRYRAEGLANTTSPYTEKLEVKSGAAATPAGQTTTLYTNTSITSTTYLLANAGSAPAVAVLPGGTGNQYVGFHAISDAVQGNLYIDDLSISTVLATTSEALLKAVTVFPNPSTGVFDLEIHGANAKGSLGVQVTNTLGQQVYTGTARDNYTNQLDLSGLAPGLYHLQVRNGDDYLTRQLAIVK